METSLKKDKRNKGFFYHKSPVGTNSIKAKSFASKDISDYIKNGNVDFGEVNYLSYESKILKLAKNEDFILNLDSINEIPFIHNKERLISKKIIDIRQFKRDLKLSDENSKLSTKKITDEWFNFCGLLYNKKIFFKGKELYKYQLFWSGKIAKDIIERKNGYDWIT